MYVHPTQGKPLPTVQTLNHSFWKVGDTQLPKLKICCQHGHDTWMDRKVFMLNIELNWTPVILRVDEKE